MSKSAGFSVMYHLQMLQQIALQCNIPQPCISALLDCMCVHEGSPLGLFLALRGVDPTNGRALGTNPISQSQPSCTSTADGLPAANRIYNLYQPYDPVAYRSASCPCLLHARKRKVFGNLNGSLLRRQPGAETIDHSPLMHALCSLFQFLPCER